MLRGVRSVLGYKVIVNEGQCGQVHDFLFDDHYWKLSQLVISIGLPHKTLRLFPLSSSTCGYIFPASRSFVLRCTSARILSLPEIDSNPPVSRQRKRRLGAHKVLIPFLPDGFAGVPVPAPFASTLASMSGPPFGVRKLEEDDTVWNSHLRSAREVLRYRVQAQDGRAGFVSDFLFDDRDFSLRYLLVQMRKLVFRKTVLVTPAETKGIDWELARVNLSIDKKTMRARRPVYE